MSRFGWGGDQWFDDNGKPLSRGKLYFYEIGTVRPKPTYSDAAQTIENTWPVVLDASGRQGDIFFTSAAKIFIRDDQGVLIDTADAVYPVPPVAGGGGDAEGVAIKAVYESVAQMVEDTTLVVGAFVETAGYTEPGDKGHNQFQIVAGESFTPDGGSVIDLDNGLQAVGLFPLGTVNVAQFGTEDDDVAVAAAIAYCATNGVRFIGIDRDIVLTEIPDEFYNVIPIGSGSMSGAFRRWVYPDRTFNQRTGWIIPELHLSQFKTTAASGTPKVVFFGDSLLTYNADALGRQNTLASMIETKFAREYPGVTIDFVNRAIGGQAWEEALTVATRTTEVWYTDDMRDWIDYVEDQTPDVVVVNLGMNRPGIYTPENIEDFVAHLATWTPVPDILFCTGLVPTLEPDPEWDPYALEGPQRARDNVSGHIRTFCLAESYGFIDVNRVDNITRDGFDIFDTYLKRAATDVDVSGTGGNYISGIEGYGYKFSGEITGTTAEITDVFDGTNGTLTALIGNQNQGPNLVFIRNLGTGVFTLDFYDGVTGGGNYYLRVTTTENIPTADFTLILEVRGNVFMMRLQDSATTRDVVRINTLRTMGADFEMRIGYAEDNFLVGPFSTVTFDTAIPELYLPTLTNDEIWGISVESTDTQLPYGSNGVNHPTSIGANAIYGKALDDVTFR